MLYFDEKMPTPSEIREIERRAHEMRAQAVAQSFGKLFSALTALPRTIANLIQRPRHA
ncbi:MAG: RSP_7527 family protein [Paracoccaceae bacterium]|jgi:hypothetical protein